MKLLFILLVIIFVGYSMLKKFNAQATLILAGLLLLSYAHFTGLHPIVDLKDSNGFWFFDLWEKFNQITNSRLGSTGLTLVSIAGVSTYFNHIGASSQLVKITSKPVMAVSSPYILLAVMLVFVSFLYVFITGATSLSLLLMGTLYPVMRNAGISAKTAVATIVIPTAWEFGPGQINAVIGAEAINVEIMEFVIKHQLVFQLVLLATIPFINILWQAFCDKREGFIAANERGKYIEQLEGQENEDALNAPTFYAFFPAIPFILLFGFSSLFSDTLKMSIPIAMMTTMSVCVFIEALRFRSIQKAFDNFSSWLQGTGMIFASVLTLMIAAEFFAAGLTYTGAITDMIETAGSMSLPPIGISIVFSLFILGIAFITGSGNAPVMAFISIVPVIATKFAINPLLILVPILFAAGIGRTVSPVAGVIITVSGMAKISPLDVVRRTSVPMLASMVVVLITGFFMY